MSFFYNIALDFICILFPIFLYLLVRIYLLNKDKYENYYFICATILSITLLLLFGKHDFWQLSIFIFIPLILNYIHKNKLVSLFLSGTIIFINNYLFNINIYILIIEYFIYFITYIIIIKKNLDIKEFINEFIIIKSFFLSFYIFYINPKIDFNLAIIYIGLTIIIGYLLSYMLYYLLNEKISIKEIDKLREIKENQNNINNYLWAITHELKNSLSISKGYLDMLNLNTNKSKDYIRIISKEVNRSIDMIQDGLNLSKDKIDYEILDINLLLEDVSDTIKEILKNKKIKYNINYIDDDIYILGDYNKLKQVLINIIKNSIESKEKDLVIEIDNEIIKDNVCISIKDNGCGIKDLDYISKGISSKYNGSGIGSIFSKNIIDRHNGKIVYESSVNEGTNVNIFLPLLK